MLWSSMIEYRYLAWLGLSSGYLMALTILAYDLLVFAGFLQICVQLELTTGGFSPSWFSLVAKETAKSWCEADGCSVALQTEHRTVS